MVRHLGNTISNSWSLIEGQANPAQLNRIEPILQQAAAQGIDVNFATGDSGDEAPRVGLLSGQFAFRYRSRRYEFGAPDHSISFQTG